MSKAYLVSELIWRPGTISKSERMLCKVHPGRWKRSVKSVQFREDVGLALGHSLEFANNNAHPILLGAAE